MTAAQSQSSPFHPVCRVSGPVCSVLTWLFTNPTAWHGLRTCLWDKSMRWRLVGDNSLCICLGVIVVVRPQSLHRAGVSVFAGRFSAAVARRSLLCSCLLFTQMWAGDVICNMNKVCLVWQQASTAPCLPRTNSSIGCHMKVAWPPHAGQVRPSVPYVLWMNH